MDQPVPRSVLTAYDRNVDHDEIDGEGIELALEFEHLCYRYGLSPDISRSGLVRALQMPRVERPATHRPRKRIAA